MFPGSSVRRRESAFNSGASEEDHDIPSSVKGFLNSIYHFLYEYRQFRSRTKNLFTAVRFNASIVAVGNLLYRL
jgi:hypothetical protein